MLERGELVGTSAESFFLSQPHTLAISNEVEVLLKMLTEIKDETKDEWIDRQATIVKVKDKWFLVHSGIPTPVPRKNRFVGLSQHTYVKHHRPSATLHQGMVTCPVRSTRQQGRWA